MRKGEPKEPNKISRLGPFSMNPRFRNDIVLGTVNLIKHSSGKPRNGNLLRSFIHDARLFVYGVATVQLPLVHEPLYTHAYRIPICRYLSSLFFFGRSVYMYIEDRVPGEASSSRTNSILWLSESV